MYVQEEYCSLCEVEVEEKWLRDFNKERMQLVHLEKKQNFFYKKKQIIEVAPKISQCYSRSLFNFFTFILYSCTT